MLISFGLFLPARCNRGCFFLGYQNLTVDKSVLGGFALSLLFLPFFSRKFASKSTMSACMYRTASCSCSSCCGVGSESGEKDVQARYSSHVASAGSQSRGIKLRAFHTQLAAERGRNFTRVFMIYWASEVLIKLVRSLGMASI